MLAPVTPYDRLEELEAENALLRDRIAKLSGEDNLPKARRVFGLTETEAVILCLLQRCGQAAHETLVGAVYDQRMIERVDDPKLAIAAHIKRLRRKIRPHGIDFRTVYCFGFEMGERARARAGRMLK